MISVKTLTVGGNPDVFIVKGEKELPNRESYDAFSDSYGSELVEIGPEHSLHDG